MGFNDIVCEFALYTFNLFDRVVDSPGCSYEFSVVYVQREKSQYLFYYNMRSIHFQEQK